MKSFAILLGLALLFNLAFALPADLKAERDDFYHLRNLENYVRSRGLAADNHNASDASTSGLASLTLKMGGSKQHMGDFNEEKIFEFVHNALHSLCPFDVCDAPGAPEDCCRDYDWHERNYLKNILYKAKGDKKAYNAYARMIMKIGRVRGNKEIRDLMLMTVAEAYKREIGANCYQQKWKGGGESTFCNIGMSVDLQVAQYRIAVDVKFNGATAYGEAKCDNWKTGAWEGFNQYKNHYFQLNDGHEFDTFLICCDENDDSPSCHNI